MPINFNDSAKKPAESTAQVAPEANTVNVGNEAPTSTGFSAVPKDVPTVSFGSTLNLMSSTRGSEFTNSIANRIEEIYKAKYAMDNTMKKLNLKVIPYDNSTFTDLAYSAVVVALESERTVYYYTILLGATGPDAFTATSIVSEMKTYIQSGGRQQPNVYTPDDANDVYLHNIIKGHLLRIYPNAEDYVSADGAILGKDESDVADIAYILANTALNAVYVCSVIFNGKNDFKDLNLTTARERTNGTLRYTSQILTNQDKADTNAFGAPVRDDWVLDLKLIANNSNIKTLNKKNQETTLSKVAGYIETGVAYETAVVNGVTTNLPSLTLQPNIVITSMTLESPSPAFVLLGLLSGTVMANPGMYLAALRTNNPKTQVGSLNVFTDVLEESVNNKSVVPSKINLADKKLTHDEVIQILKKMYKALPTISIDVPAFGPETSYLSFLTLAASPRNGSDEQAARAEILRAAMTLTNGNFDKNFNPGEIFHNQGIIVPLGTWVDKRGVRDIRDIDAAFIAGHVDDPELLTLWIKSNMPSSISGYDPFNTKIDIISKLVPDAKITGKAARLTFSAKFISELSRAATLAGLNVSYEPEIKFIANADLSSVGGFYNNAGIAANAYGFANEFVSNAPVYTTNYVNSGLYRFQ